MHPSNLLQSDARFTTRRLALRHVLAGAAALLVHDSLTDGPLGCVISSANARVSKAVADRRAAIGAVAQHLVKRYRVAEPLARQIAASAWQHARRPDIEPLLVLAIIGIESGHNPRAVSSEGAQGLMQVMPRYHSERLNALRPGSSFFDPDANIEVGVDLLHDMLNKSRGDLKRALQRYNGAPRDRQGRYASRVLAEMKHLKAAIAPLA